LLRYHGWLRSAGEGNLIKIKVKWAMGEEKKNLNAIKIA